MGPSTAPVTAASEEDRPAETLRHPRLDADPEHLVLLALQALRHAYRTGDDWNDMFDRLTPDELDRLKELFPYMPPVAARYFAERFIIPSS